MLSGIRPSQIQICQIGGVQESDMPVNDTLSDRCCLGSAPVRFRSVRLGVFRNLTGLPRESPFVNGDSWGFGLATYPWSDSDLSDEW